MNIKINNLPENAHKCYSEKEGDEIVFRCPICPDYERRISTTSGKCTLQADPENKIPHYGSFVPAGMETDQYNPN